MLPILQILFVGLVLTNFVAGAYVTQLFKLNLSTVPWKAVGVLGASLLLICYRLKLNDPSFLLTLQQFTGEYVLSKLFSLLTICVFLCGLLAFILATGIQSETVTFVPDEEMNIQISRIEDEKRYFLGYASLAKPFSKRFRSGKICFEIGCLGFDTEQREFQIRKSGLSSEERHEVIVLRAAPTFVLHNFYSYPEQADEEHYEGPPFPEKLKNYPGAAMCFTVGCSSPTEIRIQDVFVRVIGSEPLKLSTFPAYEVGNGASAIVGWVELKPQQESYRVVTDMKSKVGRKLEPSDFHFHAFCNQGYTFKISIDIDWMDIRHQDQVKRYALPNQKELELPVLVEWETLVQDAKYLKILFDDQAPFLSKHLDSLAPNVQYTIVVPSPSNDSDSDWLKGIKGVVEIPSDATEKITKILALEQATVEYEKPSRFIILDGQTLIIERELGSGILIKDAKRVKALETTFDEVIAQFRKKDEHGNPM